jgi:cell division transport system permease protein
MRAGFVMSGVASGIRRNLTMTVALVLSTSIALGFVGAAILAKTEIGRFKEAYEDKINVSIYLCPKNFVGRCTSQTTDAQKAAIDAKLQNDPTVASYKFLSEQAVYERQKQYIDPAIIKTGVYKPGVLPATYIVHLRDLRKDFDRFRAGYAVLPGVSDVTNQSDAFKTLLDIIDSFLKLSLAIAIIVLIASVLLIANTVQVAAAQRREETSIMRLVGASRAMTELPFILEVVIATLIGGLIALGAIAIGKVYVLDNVFGTQARRGVIPNLDRGDILVAGLIALGAGLVLSAITAFLTLRLRVKL